MDSEARRIARAWIDDESLDVYVEVFGNERRVTFGPREARVEDVKCECGNRTWEYQCVVCGSARASSAAPAPPKAPAPQVDPNKCECGARASWKDILDGERLCLACGSTRKALTPSS